MKELAEQNSICKAISAKSPTLALSKQSHILTKSLKPKIRIIHIFAPEVIKTDAANFRELVQRLTGMSSCKKKGKSESSTNFSKNRRSELCAAHENVKTGNGLMGIKEEEGRLWGSDQNGGVFGGLDDLDGFIRELGELPLNSARVNGAGVNQGLCIDQESRH